MFFQPMEGRKQKHSFFVLFCNNNTAGSHGTRGSAISVHSNQYLCSEFVHSGNGCPVRQVSLWLDNHSVLLTRCPGLVPRCTSSCTSVRWLAVWVCLVRQEIYRRIRVSSPRLQEIALNQCWKYPQWTSPLPGNWTWGSSSHIQRHSFFLIFESTPFHHLRNCKLRGLTFHLWLALSDTCFAESGKSVKNINSEIFTTSLKLSKEWQFVSVFISLVWEEWQRDAIQSPFTVCVFISDNHNLYLIIIIFVIIGY